MSEAIEKSKPIINLNQSPKTRKQSKTKAQKSQVKPTKNKLSKIGNKKEIEKALEDIGMAMVIMGCSVLELNGSQESIEKRYEKFVAECEAEA